MAKRDDFTNWILMHKNIPVASLEMIEETGSIVRITDVYDVKHAPVGTLNKMKIDRKELSGWLAGRSIPASRQNINQLFEGLGITNSVALALRSYGLSLSDQYWIKPDSVEISWESVNFFQNEFSEDVGEILFRNKDCSELNINVNSPDNSSDGWLQKRWSIQNGRRMLVKGGSGYFEQEPYNEEIASLIMSRMNVVHTPYKQTFIKDKAYSLCENFIGENTELVTAYNLQKSMKQLNGISDYEHLLKCCEVAGIGNVKCQLEQMMVVDYIIANTDRHWGNFGFIRDANTLDYKCFAPIYDSGTSLWHDQHNTLIDVECKSFAPTHRKQIKLIKDLSWYEPMSENDLTEIVVKVLYKHPFMNEERIDMIARGVSKKASFITELKRELSPVIIPVK